MNKRDLRKRAMAYMDQLNKDERVQIEESQREGVLRTEQWKEAATIAITMSKHPEWSTYSYLEAAWQEGKRVAVPKVEPSSKKMEFYDVRRYGDLQEGYKGIMEPDSNACFSICKSEIDLIFVPGLLFDEKGYRIGFGGGFYDRYLVDFSGNTISVTSEFQVKSSIPVEPHDIPVETLITENRTIRTFKEDGQ
ncbi:5-formyltetrahydrofolate cyclo-ligase [Salimicrobium sp. PL1-032A]|uniref:5-formyltetrahydrofolate cyclo-ligase n=1 Tax=Salimicrobium sp. PL1-032A TaxID=3095364 RepID=UPI0032615859